MQVTTYGPINDDKFQYFDVGSIPEAAVVKTEKYDPLQANNAPLNLKTSEVIGRALCFQQSGLYSP
jgi:hypothetical protein